MEYDPGVLALLGRINYSYMLASGKWLDEVADLVIEWSDPPKIVVTLNHKKELVEALEEASRDPQV